MGENLLAGLEVLGIGMLIILGMIAIIFLIIKFIFPLLAKISDRPKKEKREKTKEAQIEAPAPTEIIDNSEEDEDEIIAVITAAIAASTNRPTKSFRVVNFKRI